MALHVASRSRVLHLPLRPASGLRAPSAPAMQDDGPHPLDSTALLRGTREVLIRHRGETYRLRHTRNDKLILTK